MKDNSEQKKMVDKEWRSKVKSLAHAYANPKTKVLQSYCRIHDSFEAGALSQYSEIVNLKAIIAERDKEIEELKAAYKTNSSDKEFLNWIYERMINVHGEIDLYDYMINFKSIIDKLEPLPLNSTAKQ